MTERRDPLLTASAVLGVLVLATVALLGLTDSRPLTFRSGSMAPAIPTGSVAVVHQVSADQLRVGDVVTVPTEGTFVTHRIVQLTRSGTAATLQLKGDANETPDAELYSLASAERVVISVPWVGYVLSALTGPAGLLLGATYVVWLLRRALGGAQHRLRPTHRAPLPDRRHRRRVAVGAAAVVVVGATTVAASPRVWAAPWVDTAGVTGTVLTAGSVAPPGSFTCGALGVGTIRFTWAAVAGATDYVLYVNNQVRATLSATSTSANVDGMGGSGTAYIVTRRAFGSVTWTSAPSVSRNFATTLVLTTCG